MSAKFPRGGGGGANPFSAIRIMAKSGNSSLLENSVYPTWHFYFCIYMYEADGSRITVDSKIDENRCKQKKKMNKSC